MAFCFREGLKQVFTDYFFQGHAVRAIKMVCWWRVLAKVVHLAKTLAADVVSQGMLTKLKPMLGASLGEGGRKAIVPIRNRSASVKGQRMNVR